MDVHKMAQELGRRGGAVGGKSRSKAKISAVRRNIAVAREKRWPKKHGNGNGTKSNAQGEAKDA